MMEFLYVLGAFITLFLALVPIFIWVTVRDMLAEMKQSNAVLDDIRRQLQKENKLVTARVEMPAPVTPAVGQQRSSIPPKQIEHEPPSRAPFAIAVAIVLSIGAAMLISAMISRHVEKERIRAEIKLNIEEIHRLQSGR